MEERREISQKELDEMVENCAGVLILENIKMVFLKIFNTHIKHIDINNCDIQFSRFEHLNADIYIYNTQFIQNYIQYSKLELRVKNSNLQGTVINFCGILHLDIKHCDIYGLFFENSKISFESLRDKEGNNCKLLLLNYPEYIVNIKGKDHIKVGCQEHSFDQWMSFSKEEICELDGEKALDFFEKTLKPLLIETFGL